MSATARKYLKPEDEPRYAEALVQLQEVPVIGVMLLQRRLKIGWNQACRIINELEYAKQVRKTETGRYERIGTPHSDRLPRVVLVNENGNRDTLSQGAHMEFVFAAGRAVRVKLDVRNGKPCVLVSEVRDGNLLAVRSDDGSVVVTSN